jgi:hypothetical protein
MGLLRTLFAKPLLRGATNALLVELALPRLTPAQRAELKTRCCEIQRRSDLPAATDETILNSLNRAPRVAQLNCLALAMKELGYAPPLTDEAWYNVRNPFDPHHSDQTILRDVARRIFSHHGLVIAIGSKPLSFDLW